MKILSLLFTAIFLTLLTTVNSVSANGRQAFRVANVNAADVLNVRQRPSMKSSVILQLPADARWILKRTSQRQGNWQKVIWGVKEGWVHNHYLGSDAKATKVLVKHRQCVSQNPNNSMCCGYTGTSKNRNPIKAFKVVGVPRGESLNVRASGSAKAQRIANIPHNALGIVKFPSQQVRQGRAVWQKIRWNGRDGWVNAAYLKYDPIISDYRNIVQQACSH